MRKFLLLFAAICCAMSSWAGDDAFSNFTYDEETGQLKFHDSFYEGHNFPARIYIVLFSTEKWSISFGANGVRVEDNRPNAKGGDVAISIRTALEQAIDSCYTRGYQNLKISVDGVYRDDIGWAQTYRDSYVDYVTGYKADYEYHLPNAKPYLIAGKHAYFYDEESPEEVSISAHLQGVNAVTYSWQESTDNGLNWTSAANFATNGLDASPDYGGYLTTLEAREGQYIDFKCRFNKLGKQKTLYRLYVKDIKTDEEFFTDEYEVKFAYPWQIANGPLFWAEKGEEKIILKPEDCHEYQYKAAQAVHVTEDESYIYLTMPGCPLYIEDVSPTYTVKFINRDNNCTVLKTEQVACGSDATPPANPTLSGATFTGWSQSYTNVHNDLVIWANYDFGSNYVFEARQAMHLNERYPYMDFAGSDTKAMVGDKITLEADVKTPANASVCFEQGSYDASGNLTWFGEDQFETTSAGVQKTVSKDIYVAWYPMSETENPFQRRVAYRFVVKSSGQTFYSNAFEYDVYYKQTVNASTDMVIFDGEFYWPDGIAVPPARYGDTIFIKRRNGGNDCLSMARVNNPSGAFESGLTADGDAFFLCPGQTETINVTVPPVAVIFDGAWPTQQYDFSAQGLGKHNAYYAELSECGGQVLPPADPAEDNMIFKGWTAWSDEYADDAYLRIPSGQSIIGFSAQWEDIPVATIYTVTFKDWDGTTLKTEEVAEGENATPPAVGGREGYHFVGWDGSYTTVTANLVLTAQYGQDEKIWTVTFLDWDGTTLNTQEVLDGMPAAEPVVVREGYKFQYWINNSDHLKADVTHVWSDMTVKAFYTSTEGIEEIVAPKEKAVKYLINGHIYIATPDGRVYDVSGRRLR